VYMNDDFNITRHITAGPLVLGGVSHSKGFDKQIKSI